ncbi:hypothetical protein G9A89_011314 [Geosiphon pyriformis]|nr:hypothetical protein G9A89_011314 [Geosiphon pyriformis]
MSKCTHDTNVKFNLRYLGKNVIKLESYSHICIDLKVALKIPATTMIAQTIFLSLIKIAQLVLVRNRKKLGITAKEIQRFGSMGRIDIPVNMAEKKITEAILCESKKIRLVNLYIPAKNYDYIKIPIYNNTGDIIEIPEGTTIGYLTTEIKDQLPNTIPDFPQLCEYIRRILSAPTRTIETDELGKSRLTTTYAT